MVANRLVKLLVIFLLSFSFARASAQGVSEERIPGGGPRAQLATIVFSGLGGAILGLSTLSFYGRPQDKLSNIAVGFALGIIAGTIYTTYRTATNPYGGGNYDEVSIIDLERDVTSWESSLSKGEFTGEDQNSVLGVQHTWTF